MGIRLKPSRYLTARNRIAIKKGGHAQPKRSRRMYPERLKKASASNGASSRRVSSKTCYDHLRFRCQIEILCFLVLVHRHWRSTRAYGMLGFDREGTNQIRRDVWPLYAANLSGSSRSYSFLTTA